MDYVAEALVDEEIKHLITIQELLLLIQRNYREIHRTEPYVYSQMVAGKDASRFGEAKNSWLTGTASWNFIAISQYILGIKA